MTEVKSVADRVVDVYGRISEMLGTDESIRSRLKANSTNPFIADFVDATFEAVEDRAATIENNASNVDIIYCISLVNALEVSTITIDRLLKSNGTATHLDDIANRLWEIWSGLDEAMNLCPDRLAWELPTKAAEILESIKAELVQSIT